MKLKNRILLTLTICLLTSVNNFAQNRIEELTESAKKNDYAILEVRLNMEDEFRTLEGRDTQGMSRIALYTGINKDEELLNKGFLGYNQVVQYLNEMKNNGWILEDTYSITGSFLILNHYVFRKKK
jgi:hypothetical protein